MLSLAMLTTAVSIARGSPLAGTGSLTIKRSRSVSKLVSLAISNARNSGGAAMLKGVSLFSEELAPCVAENRVRSRSLPTIYRPFNKLHAARVGLGIKSGEPASSWESPTALRRKS